MIFDPFFPLTRPPSPFFLFLFSPMACVARARFDGHILIIACIRNLTPWAEAGVLMLNTCLTVRAHSAGSHQGKGWEQFTDRVIEAVDRYGGANLGEKSGVGRGVVFLAWGAWAAKRVAKLSKVRACGSRALHPLLLSSPIPHPTSFFALLYSSAACMHILQADTFSFFFFTSSRLSRSIGY